MIGIDCWNIKEGYIIDVCNGILIFNKNLFISKIFFIFCKEFEGLGEVVYFVI